MKITSKGRYGLKAMIELATEYAVDAPLIKSREIASKQEIPLKYLEQIISILKRNNLVLSVRGAEGGYRLARPPGEISVLEILTALEGDLSVIDKNDDTWRDGYGIFWTEIDETVSNLLNISLEEFKKAQQRSQEALMYYI